MFGEASAREFVGRLVFNVAIGNGDMHLKNWSVIYRDGKTPELSPAYDDLSSIVYLPNDKLGLSIAGSKEWSDVSADHLERWARKSGVPRGVVLDAARAMTEKIRDSWPRFKKTVELDGREVRKIDAHMAAVPLLSGGRIHAIGATALKTPAVPATEDQPEIA